MSVYHEDEQPRTAAEAYSLIDQHMQAIQRLRVVAQQLAAQEDQRVVAAIIDHADLSTAEQRVARLLATTFTIGHIARRLHLSANTVKTHTQNIYRKLGVNDRAAAREVLRQHAQPEAVSAR